MTGRQLPQAHVDCLVKRVVFCSVAARPWGAAAEGAYECCSAGDVTACRRRRPIDDLLKSGESRGGYRGGGEKEAHLRRGAQDDEARLRGVSGDRTQDFAAAAPAPGQ